jgi:cell division protein FtsB
VMMKKDMRHNIIKFFLSAEVITVLFFYLFGVQGLPALYRLKQENISIEQEIGVLQLEVANLAKTIQEWHDYPYYTEKIAREQLQMARQGDIVYYIPTKNKGA